MDEIARNNEDLKDRFRIVYILFVLSGIVNVLPTTFFVTAHDYWMYKFRNTSYSGSNPHRTTLQAQFSPSVSISTQVAVITSSFLTVFFGHKFSVRLRLYGPLTVVLTLYIISAAFIHIDTDSWQTGFFVLTMTLITGTSAMTAIFTLTLFSIIAKFPTNYIGSFVNGEGLAPIVTSSLQILSLAIGIGTTNSALVYFWITITMLCACLLLLITIARHNRYYNFHNAKNQHDRRKMSFREFLSTAKAIWKSLCVFCLFFWTVNPTHPAITSLVVSEGAGEGEWNDVYFVPVATFLLSAVCDSIGRCFATKFYYFKEIDGVWYILFSVARIIVFVPLLRLCNAQPRSYLPVIFSHDYQYILIMIFFSFTNGFILTMETLIITKSVASEQLEDAYHVNLVAGGIFMGVLSFLGSVSVQLL